VVLQWFGSVPSHRICQSLAQQLSASEGALQRQQMVHQQRVAAQQAAATQEIVHLHGTMVPWGKSEVQMLVSWFFMKVF